MTKLNWNSISTAPIPSRRLVNIVYFHKTWLELKIRGPVGNTHTPWMWCVWWRGLLGKSYSFWSLRGQMDTVASAIRVTGRTNTWTDAVFLASLSKVKQEMIRNTDRLQLPIMSAVVHIIVLIDSCALNDFSNYKMMQKVRQQPEMISYLKHGLNYLMLIIQVLS